MQIGGILYDIISNIQIWLIVLLTTVTCVLPYIIYRRWEVLFYNDIINNLRHDKYQKDFNKKTYMKKIEAVSKYTRSIAKFRKIFNKQDDFEPENLADKKIKAVVDGFRSSRRKSRVLRDEAGNLLASPDFNPQMDPFPLNNVNNNVDFNGNDNDNNNDLNGNYVNNIDNEARGFRKYSNYDELQRAISLDNNNNPSSKKIDSRTANSLLRNNNNKKNNAINSNNRNQASIDLHGNSANQMQINNSYNQPFKNKSSSNTNNQNSSSNNFNYNFIHPYDEEDLINQHLGGKFKPITTTASKRVLNPNDSFEKEYKIVSRENNKFEFNYNKFKNNNGNNNAANSININNNNVIVNNFNGTLGADNNTNIESFGNSNLIKNNNNNNDVMNRVNNNLINQDDNANANEQINSKNNSNGNENRNLIENNINNIHNENADFDNNNNNFGHLDDNDYMNLRNPEQEDDLIVSNNLKQTSQFYHANDDSKRKFIENEKIESKSISRKSDSKNNSTKNVLKVRADSNSKKL